MMSVLMTVPAIRTEKMSPSPWSKISSAEVRLSMQLTIGRERPLTVTRLVGLLQQVAIDAQVVDEATIAFAQEVEGR